MQAVKWLSDNSLLWTTKGRGASPRTSIQNNPQYKTAGLPWDLRGAFVEGVSYATLNQGVPVLAAQDFAPYAGDNFLAKTLDEVWNNKKSIDDAMTAIQTKWQSDLDEG